MRRAEGGMQRKGRRREVRGNVGGDGREERRWRASEEEGSRGEPRGGSRGRDERGQDGRLREEGRMQGDAEPLKIVS